jgi:hypothetical protein
MRDQILNNKKARDIFSAALQKQAKSMTAKAA